MRAFAPLSLAAIFALLLSCGSDDPVASVDGGPGTGPGADGGGVIDSGPVLDPDGNPVTGSAAQRLAKRLRGKSSFLVGIGNGEAETYSLGVTMDLHYEYLVGVAGEGGDWPSWNTDANGSGAYVTKVAEEADKHGTTPMFTIYMMASRGDGDLSLVTDGAFMKKYWEAARLALTRAAAFGKAVAFHLEPDFWGYAQQSGGGAKGRVAMSGNAPDCPGVSDDFAGIGQCWLAMRDKLAPKVAIGFHISSFGGDVPSTLAFFKAVGADRADFIATDMLDRDAGCFEAHVDPNCQRTEGNWYWDETNTKSPNFHEHLAWVKQLTTGLGVPMMWWQVPFGVPSATPGGTAGHYRDNRVKYMFSHMDELVAAGGAGAAFGTGAGNQTTVLTDGGQFKNAVTKYFAAPTPLP